MSITIGGKTPETIFINQKEVMNISINNDVVWGNEEYNLNYMWLKNTANNAGTLTLTKTGTPNASELYYSFDKVSWTAFDLTQASSTVSIPAGKTCRASSMTETGIVSWPSLTKRRSCRSWSGTGSSRRSTA